VLIGLDNTQMYFAEDMEVYGMCMG